MDKNSTQNQTPQRAPLQRPVRTIQQQVPEQRERISKIMGAMLIITAACIDAFEALLTFLAIGLALNPIISVVADVAFMIWFWTLGVTFVKKPKNLAAMGIQALIGLIPGLDILPELTVGVTAIVLLTRSEDKGGLLGKAAGMAQGKIKT